MSQLLTAAQICEQALRVIGTYSRNDESADATSLEIALTWLDLNMAELSGVERCWWLISETIEIPLVAGQSEYDILGSMGSNAPTDGMQFPYTAKLNDGTGGNFTPIEIVSRHEWEEIANLNTSGKPHTVWIDRKDRPTMFVYPVPGDALVGYSIDMVVQAFAPSVSSSKVTAHGLRLAWQKWAILQVAADIGDGPVIKLGMRELDRLERKAERSKERLLAYENKEHVTNQHQANFRY